MKRMSQLSRLIFVVLTFAVLLLTGCGGGSDSTPTKVFTADQVSGKTFAYASSTGTTGTLIFNTDGTWNTAIGTSTFGGTWSITDGKLVCVTTSGGNHTLTYTALVSDDNKAIHTSVVEVNPADLGNPATYTATLTALYTISGKVSQSDAGLAGVTVSLEGDQTLTATTDADGNYRFMVPAGEYRVTPSKGNATFAPLDNSLAVSGANVGAVDFASVAPMAGPSLNKWIQTGSMIYKRSNHTATFLSEPKELVLVAGGYNSTSGLIRHVEFYDWASGTWYLGSDMIYPRRGHTATLLQNRKVLLAGGQSIKPTSTSATAELFDLDPGSRFNVSLTGSMKYERIGHTATLLPNGKVLVAGGGDVAGNLSPGAELYDPETGTWTLTGPMKYDRSGHTAILLLDGKVLVAGGRDVAGNSRASAELYDPETGTWTQTGSLNFGRTLFTATGLFDGKILVAGGADLATLDARASAELYDPTTGQWTQTGSLNQKRLMHTASSIANGKVLVAGGSFTSIQQYLLGPSRIESPLASAEIYDYTTGQWTQTGSLNYERSGHTATISIYWGNILITGGYGGGENQDIYRASSEWFIPGP